MSNIITLDEIKNKSIDEIIELYRYGYKLGDTNSIESLQCPSGCYNTTDYFLSIGVGILIGWFLRIGYQKTKGTWQC